MATEPTSDEVIVELSLKEALDRANAKEVKVRVALNAANGERNRLKADLKAANEECTGYIRTVDELRQEVDAAARRAKQNENMAGSIRILMIVISDYQLQLRRVLPPKA